MVTTDKRVARTQLALRDALEKLAQTHEYHEITVTKLTQTAGINRKTFYLHYDSIDDLIDTFADQVSGGLGKIIQSYSFKTVYTHPGLMLDDAVTYVRANDAVIQHLLFPKNYTRFAQRIEDNLVVILTKSIRQSYPIDQQDAEIAAYFMVHNTLSLFSRFSRDHHLDFDQFKSYVARLNLTGLSSFFDPRKAY
ncbi:TetR/AcrR family transcriptional regulator [Levilactobacillus acidifarinae]|nr:TetR/AcrR family transcriptional regulator [Levilactobacillus acidifarinae]GEO69314.1 TetR family transcriptional regulator [Levilactobacillus acidifarinae]